MVLGSLYAKVYAEVYAKGILRYNIMTKDYPIDINFETTTACNLKCKYCPRYELIGKGIRDAGHMDYDLVNKIIKDMSKISDKRFSVCPVSLGEPLLYPQILDVLKLLRERLPKAYIHINTNAVLLNEEFSRELIKTGIDDIIFSINIWDEELYKRYHGVDALPDVIENIKRFLQMKGDGKPRVVLQILDIDINKEKIGAFISYWKPYLNKNDVIYIRPLCDYGGRISLKDFVSQQREKNAFHAKH